VVSLTDNASYRKSVIRRFSRLKYASELRFRAPEPALTRRTVSERLRDPVQPRRRPVWRLVRCALVHDSRLLFQELLAVAEKTMDLQTFCKRTP
jgi:hypothetical protein